MPQNNQITSLIKGETSDLHNLLKPSDAPIFVLNGNVTSNEGGEFLYQNDPSNYLKIDFPKDFKVIGYIEIHEQKRVIYFLVNPLTKESKIVEVKDCFFTDKSDVEYDYSDCDGCDNKYNYERVPLEEKTQEPYCNYSIISESRCLNFNIDFPVDIEYEILPCSLMLYFTDNLNQRRHLELEYENDQVKDNLVVRDFYKVITGYEFGDCNNPIYGTDIDCNKMSYHPEYKRPCVDFKELTYGGNLKAGTYQFLIAYTDRRGTPLTQYFPATQNIPIKDRNVTVDTNYITDKSIVVEINNIEREVFTHFNIVVAETIDNFTTFKLVNTLPTLQVSSDNSLTITYNGINTIRDLTFTDVIFRRPFYEKAKSVTKSGDFLFFSNLKEFPQLNLQRAANEVKLYWQTIAIPESVYNSPKNVFNFRTYQRDEVYAFGIVFETTHGEDTCVFHIPNREPNSYDLDYVIGDDVYRDLKCETGFKGNPPINALERWRVYNTASIIGRPHQFTDSCTSDNCWEWGEFAYWQSENRYDNIPEIWGDLCGKNIRHHKMPDSCITHIHDGLNANKRFEDNNIVYPIGIKVDHLSVINALDKITREGVITQEQRNSIKGYRIVRANRVGNKSIIAKGLLYDMWKYDKYGNSYHYANYPFNDLRPDKFISAKPNYGESTTSDPNPILFSKSGRYTFHSPDTHFSSPSIGGFLKLETEEYGYSEGFFNYAEEQAKQRFLSTFSHSIAMGIAIATAFSQEKHRECKTVSLVPSTVLTVQGAATAISTVPVPRVAVGQVITPPASLLYARDTGLETRFTGLNVGTVTYNTCKGTPYQLTSPLGALNTRDPLLILLNSLLGFANQVTYILMIIMREYERWKEFILSLTPYKNLSAQYQAVGKYNNYKCVPNEQGIKIRRIDRSSYLAPIIQNVDEVVQSTGLFSTTRVNNWNRESSVYLKTDSTRGFLPATTNIDNSRFTMDDVGIKEPQDDKFEKLIYRNISSYYGSIKREVVNQYGNLNTIEYLETNGCSTDLKSSPNQCMTIFGGDTFITRFALKRKMPFFLNTRFRFADGSDVIYSELGNVGYPNYFFNTDEPLFNRLEDLSGIGSFLQKIVGVNRTRLDGKTSKLFYQNGFAHLYSYGIPYFLVESDFNTDYRHAGNLKEESYYPLSSDIRSWLQEKEVPISFDNSYLYNSTYSRQNKESFLCTPTSSRRDFKNCTAVLPTRTIYSLDGNFLIFRANDFYDFPLSDGSLISADGIESDKILVRLENTSKIFSAYETIQTSAETIQIGTGGIFQSRPKEFSVTDLGYAGSQNRDLLKTEFGHIWIDAQRGQIFNLLPGGQGLTDLTKDNVRHWFKENLPFKIKQYFPTITSDDLDNNFKGIGIHMGFDKRLSSFYITKLDYVPKNKNITYNKEDKKFYLEGEEISIYDEKYFCDASWTRSYSFLTQSWNSFFSFTPNYYIENIENFETGIQKNSRSSVWSHNISNKSYQVYYGKKYPFIVEFITNKGALNNYITSIEFVTEAIRYHNDQDYFYNNNVTFNKAIVYNEKQSTGLLELIKSNKDDLSQFINYPKNKPTSTEILISNSENFWRINDLFDISKSEINNLPLMLSDCANVDKKINQKAIDQFKPDFDKGRIRARQSKVRLIQDEFTNYKLILLLGIVNQNISIR
ncbi:hypothetical protein [Leptolyngbya phage Lbo-JY46]